MLDEDEAVSVAGLVAPVDPAPALLMELESRPLSAVSAICCWIRMTNRRNKFDRRNAGRSDAKKRFAFSLFSLSLSAQAFFFTLIDGFGACPFGGGGK